MTRETDSVINSLP